MKVLVTGGAGFIGSHLVERLQERGDEVHVVDDFNDFYDPRQKRDNLSAAKEHAAFRLHEGDIRSGAFMEDVFAQARPQVVIHIAARAGVRPSLLEPELYLDVNVSGTGLLLECSRRWGVEHFVFASSSSVYGNDSSVPFQEDAAADRPASPYGATKRMGELLAYSYHHLYGLPVAALRLFTVYGPRCRPDLAVHKFSRLIAGGQPVPIYGDGSAWRDFTYVDDIVGGILRAVDRRQGFEIINLGYGKPVRVLELVSMLEERLGATAQLDFQPPQAGDVEKTWADVSKAERLLGWRPTTSIERGLDHWCEWFLSKQALEMKR
ncbi:MAG TPA: GDP-mannose 4,6-dehydratase [Dehalococcoidia bacterium]|nr:GDP-mannose 4,6-dehydratase [Dehalococcoidia bacterium]